MKSKEISNVIIVHGSNACEKEKLSKGFPTQDKRNWLPWIKEKLEEKGIECKNPLMPNNDKPKYEEWKQEVENIKVDKNSVLIGHSAGGAFLVRWLGDTKKKIKKLILVAPAKIAHEESDYIKDFYSFYIDQDIKERVNEIVIIKSNDDHNYILKSSKIYEKALGGKVIELKRKGHFTETSMGTKEFPELLEEILY